jgi:hypothetical protein
VKHGEYQTMASTANDMKSAMCRRWQGTLSLPRACTALCLKPQGKLIFINMMHIEGFAKDIFIRQVLFSNPSRYNGYPKGVLA